jgi:hypothetical protein
MEAPHTDAPKDITRNPIAWVQIVVDRHESTRGVKNAPAAIAADYRDPNRRSWLEHAEAAQRRHQDRHRDLATGRHDISGQREMASAIRQTCPRSRRTQPQRQRETESSRGQIIVTVASRACRVEWGNVKMGIWEMAKSVGV